MIVLSSLLDWFSQSDTQTLSAVSLAAVLAAIWIFFKIVRKIIGIAFFLCLVYIGLHCCGIDVLSLFCK
ncbi:MAG: hypothetical protein IJO34_04440 [Akkermansia sp.]|nr:hypothetical protein [Akkermansia sp.]